MLDKGLTFIPTYRSLPINSVYSSQVRLIRNLKLKDYFQDKPDKDFDYSRKSFTNRSTWTPADHKVSGATLSTIQNIVSSTESVLNKYKLNKHRYLLLNHRKLNLTPLEQQALGELKRKESIVIKPADKGSATVIMNKSSYLNEVYRQLNNQQYYRKLDHPIYKSNIDRINNILRLMQSEGFISDKQYQFLKASDSDRYRIFYLLPKIHKPKDKWPQPGEMPEGRPIVSDCASESYRVSQYIDSFIRPISIKHESYLKDTYDFVSKIRGKRIPKNAILVTGDVSALYTNMNIDRTLQVAKQAMEKYPNPLRPDKYILQLLDITLKNNDFMFNNEYYLQVCGTAMGKTYAPGLADLYMAEFDVQARRGFKVNPLHYYRYLDDIFFVWTGTVQELQEYETYLNTLIPGIKITLQYSYNSVDFLDTTVYKQVNAEENDAVLQTKVFFKPTDTHQLLHKQSFHPRHTATGVLKSQFLRFKRISSSRADYDEACHTLCTSLANRKYSKSMMRKMKRDIWSLDDVTPKNNDNSNSILPIVLPYNHIGTELAHQWKNCIKENNILGEYKLITAYTNGKNLYKHLISSSFSNPDPTMQRVTQPNLNSTAEPNKGCRQCTNTKCKSCNYIVTSCKFTSSVNRKTFNVIGNVNCKSCNVVYLVTCKKCRQQYVGETARPLGDRINDHLSCIRLRKSTPIGLHFTSAGHRISDFSIIAIEKFEPGPRAQEERKMKEATWQHLLQTAHPLGINNLKQVQLH